MVAASSTTAPCPVRPPGLSVSAAVFRGVTLEGFWLKRWTDRCADLGEALNALAMDPPPLEIAARFSLHQVHEALALAKSLHRRGRVLLVPGAQPMMTRWQIHLA